MYRDADAEVRQRALERRDELVERARTALRTSYGAPVRAELYGAVRRIADVPLDALGAACAELESILARYEAMAADIAKLAKPFAALGVPSVEAEPWTSAWNGCSTLIELRVREVLVGAAARWVAQARAEALVDPTSDGVSLWFEQDEKPLRIDIGYEIDDEGDVFARSSLVGIARAPRSPVRIRPQTFGDDMLALVGVRDPRVGHDEIDGLYFFEAEADVVREVVTEGVTKQLLRVAREDPADIEIVDACVTMKLGRQSLVRAIELVLAFHPDQGAQANESARK